MVQLFKENGKYGIKDGDTVCVPNIYDDPSDAIFEWECFEFMNTDSPLNRKFLLKTRTHGEIDEIVQSLKTQI